MRMADISEGDMVLVAHRSKATVLCNWKGLPSHIWPAMVVWHAVMVAKKLPRGRLVIEESYMTWDYENRPPGDSLTAWQMGTKKRAVRRTKQSEISARRVRACKQSSSAGQPMAASK